MTFEALWTALRAAERIAEVYGLTVDAKIMANPRLYITMRDAAHRPVCGVSLLGTAIDACQSPEQLTDLVEREVAGVLRARQGAVS